MVGLDERTIERLSDGQPPYRVEVSNDADTTRARARVLPNNFLGALDALHNLTLMKVADHFPSDPKGV
jgi:hypothetical protein